MKIGIDKGHSKSGAGTGASGLLVEVVENRKIGDRLIAMLKEKGHTVVDCSVDSATSTDAQLSGIVKKANAQSLDLFVSIHLNAGGGHGTETYIYNGNYSFKESNRAKAKAINDAVVSSCGFRNRGVKEANLYVIRETVAPAVLVEVCFVDSAEDKGKLNTEAVAKALFKGITGTEYISPTTSTNPSTGASDVKYRVVCGTYADKNNAIKQQERLKQAGFDSFLLAVN